MLIDTHSHIYLEQFDQDRQDVVDNALNSKVNKIILPNIDSNTVLAMHKVKDQWPSLFKMALGLHPTSVDTEYNVELDKVFNNFSSDKYVAIGEIGIDLYWDISYKEFQKSAFDYQLNFAVKNNLPVIIHSRNSFNEVFDILKMYVPLGIRGVFHCFPGDYIQAKKIVDFGFYIGVGGVLTYKKSNMVDVVEKISLDHIILETDSPYLSPVPKRGKRNEPAYVKYVAEKLSEIIAEDFDKVCEITTLNARQLFKL